MIQSIIIVDKKSKLSANPDSNTYILQPEQGKQIAIKDVRELLHWTSQTSFGDGLKYALILQAHRLGLESQQALLKTLEEPPNDTRILMTVDQLSSLLPTTVSRCAVFHVERLDPTQLNEWKLHANAEYTPSEGLSFVDFINQSPLERWLSLQEETKTKGSLLILLERWLNEASHDTFTLWPATQRIRHIQLLDEALLAYHSHVQPKLILDHVLSSIDTQPQASGK